MTLYDTHAHFSDGDDVAALYARAAEAGVAHILAVGGSEELNRNALRTPGRVALGWDRDQLDDVPSGCGNCRTCSTRMPRAWRRLAKSGWTAITGQRR